GLHGPARYVVGSGLVATVGVFVGAASPEIQSIVALVESARVVIQIDRFTGRDVAGALEDLQGRARALALRVIGAVPLAGIPHVEQGLLFKLRQDRDCPSGAPRGGCIVTII